MPTTLSKTRDGLISVIWGIFRPVLDLNQVFWGMFFRPQAAWIGALSDERVDAVLLGRS